MLNNFGISRNSGVSKAHCNQANNLQALYRQMYWDIDRLKDSSNRLKHLNNELMVSLGQFAE